MTLEEKLREIEARVDKAEADGSFALRVSTWLTAGDGRDFCAQAPDDIRSLLAALRLAIEQRDAHLSEMGFDGDSVGKREDNAALLACLEGREK